MDDFLHNLRSGKLKHPDRGRRDYTDYKGPQRRAGNERRKPDYYAKVTGENFALVKDSLDALADHQKRIADAMAARKKTDARIADALETIAAMLGRHWGYEKDLPRVSEPLEAKPESNGMRRTASSRVRSWRSLPASAQAIGRSVIMTNPNCWVSSLPCGPTATAGRKSPAIWMSVTSLPCQAKENGAGRP